MAKDLSSWRRGARSLSLALACATTVAAGCQGSGGGSDVPASGASNAASAGASVAGSAAASGAANKPAADPGPILTRVDGAMAATELPDLVVTADAVLTTPNGVYLQIAMPDATAGLVPGLLEVGDLRVRGDRHAFAVPAGEGRVPDRPLAYVRLSGAEAAGDLEVVWRQPATLLDAGVRQVLKVRTEGAEAMADLDQRFFEAAARWFSKRGNLGTLRASLFGVYAARRFEVLADQRRPEALRRPQRLPMTDLNEAMRLYTGLASVEEALQADRALDLPADAYRGPDRALSALEPVSLPGHPWAEMLAALGKPPVVEPLAAFAPLDHAWLHFHDLRTLVRLGEDVEALLSPVGRVVEEQPGERHLVSTYEKQLGLRRTALSKTLGHVATQGVGLVVSDPFFRDGTGIGLLFHVRGDGKLLETTLATYEAEIRARHKDVTDYTYQVGPHTVRHLMTPDRTVWQHRVRIDDVELVANSKSVVEAVLAAKGGTAPSLADAGEYRYFRARTPFGTETEDGYAYLSDAFVLKAISPRSKVLQGRRMVGRSEIMAINFAAMLYGWLEGKTAPDTATLIKAGLLDKGATTHAGGGEILFDPALGAHSQRFGDARISVPLDEMPLTRVSETEAGAYERFRETYSRYWRGFIDPVGVRIRRGDDGRLSLDARMLPLISGSDYNELERMVGRQRVTPGPAATGFRMVLAVGADASLRRELSDLGRSATGNRDLGLDWLGDWVMVGVADRSGLWDAALSLGEIPSARGRTADREVDTRKKVLDRMPLYAGLHVKNKLTLAANLSALKGLVNSAAPGMVTWEPNGDYREQSVVTVRERIDGDGVGVHYAIVKDVFLISLERGTLEQQIDAVLAGEIPGSVPAGKAEDEATDAAQSSLEIRPASADGWLVRTLLGLTERGVVSANRLALMAADDLDRSGLIDPTDAAALSARAARWLGFEPMVAHGGTFVRDPDGAIGHSLVGTAVAPFWPAIPVKDSPITAFYQTIATLRATLSFEGEGNTRGLRSTVEWQRAGEGKP